MENLPPHMQFLQAHADRAEAALAEYDDDYHATQNLDQNLATEEDQ